MKNKGIIFGILFFLLFALTPNSHALTLAWDANKEVDLAGYKVYYGESSRNYGPSINIPCPPSDETCTSNQIDNLKENTTYYFAVTAYDQAGNESDYSEEVLWNSPNCAPTNPQNLILKDGECVSINISITK